MVITSTHAHTLRTLIKQHGLEIASLVGAHCTRQKKPHASICLEASPLNISIFSRAPISPSIPRPASLWQLAVGEPKSWKMLLLGWKCKIEAGMVLNCIMWSIPLVVPAGPIYEAFKFCGCNNTNVHTGKSARFTPELLLCRSPSWQTRQGKGPGRGIKWWICACEDFGPRTNCEAKSLAASCSLHRLSSVCWPSWVISSEERKVVGLCSIRILFPIISTQRRELFFQKRLGSLHYQHWHPRL